MKRRKLSAEKKLGKKTTTYESVAVGTPLSLAISALMIDGSGVLCKCSNNRCSILLGGVMLITVAPLCRMIRYTPQSHTQLHFFCYLFSRDRHVGSGADYLAGIDVYLESAVFTLHPVTVLLVFDRQVPIGSPGLGREQNDPFRVARNDRVNL